MPAENFIVSEAWIAAPHCHFRKSISFFLQFWKSGCERLMQAKKSLACRLRCV